jgi:hypothetical protein
MEINLETKKTETFLCFGQISKGIMGQKRDRGWGGKSAIILGQMVEKGPICLVIYVFVRIVV